MTETLKRLWRKEYFQTAVILILIAAIVSGFWFGSQIALNTKILPVLAVQSGSMCIPHDGACEGWLSMNHPFERTLHKGDLIVIQGVDPKDLNVDYPNSDIIVYQNPRNPSDPNDKIVHRIVAKQETNGTLYFFTKGDGNGSNKWPDTPSTSEYDPWSPVPQDLIYGKVVFRIPWIGHLALFLHSATGGDNSLSIIAIIVAIIVILVILEVLWPSLKHIRVRITRKTQVDQTPSPSPTEPT